ncbi:hypothetical protein LCM17_18680 [Cereibacter sphaeroides]|nr:hypothetical protein [Cereibacter sphaeroides]
MITAWVLDDAFYPTLDAEGGDVDMRRRFEPDVGPPIERPATTAAFESWSLRVIAKTRAELATLTAWGRSDLGQWTKPFIWRHPRTRAITRWKFVGAPRHVQRSGEVVELAFGALCLPGSPWFAPYVPGTRARLPAWVADYTGGVYGVGDERGSVSDLSAITGTYEVWEKRSNDTQGFTVRTYSGDVPTSAPAGVDWLVGFTL